MIITISGEAGSGKSTVAQALQRILGWERIYVGGIRRELARKKGMTLEELNEYAKNHTETDVDIDKEVAAQARALDKAGKNVVVEGRTQFHFLPESLKVFMKVSHDEAARRIWKELQDTQKKEKRNEGGFTSFEELKRSLIERDKNDAIRYKKYYGFDHRDETQFDLVIDTTHLTPEGTVQHILDVLRQHKAYKGKLKKLNHE